MIPLQPVGDVGLEPRPVKAFAYLWYCFVDTAKPAHQVFLVEHLT